MIVPWRKGIEGAARATDLPGPGARIVPIEQRNPVNKLQNAARCS